MPENEFEKQVQQKMDELQFRPSPAVWSEVERRIRTERKRRILLFWLPLLGLLVGGGITILSITAGQHSDKTLAGQSQSAPASNTQSNTSSNQQQTENNTTQPSTDNTSNTSTGTETLTDKNADANNITTSDKNQPGTNNQQKDDQQAAVNTFNPSSSRDKEDASFNVTNSARANRQRKQPAVISKDKTTGQEIIATTPAIVKTDVPATVTEPGKEITTSKEVTVPATTDVTVATPAADSQAIAKKEEPLPPVEEKTTEASQPGKVKNTRKWKWGVEVNTGLSNAREGELLGGSTEKRADQLFYNSAPGATSSIYGPLIGSPVSVSAPRIGHSIGAEVYAQKDISKKLSIQIGLRFTQMTTRQKVGRHFDNPIRVTNNIGAVVDASGYYSAPNSLPSTVSDYTNRYNFAGISAMLAWKVIDKKKFTLNWENGIVINQLVSSNALHFSSSLRGYYKDFSMFNKTQFMLSTALSVPVWRTKNTTLLVRPFGSYGLTPLLKESTTAPVYMVNYGLGLRLLFGNKK